MYNEFLPLSQPNLDIFQEYPLADQEYEEFKEVQKEYNDPMQSNTPSRYVQNNHLNDQILVKNMQVFKLEENLHMNHLKKTKPFCL